MENKFNEYSQLEGFERVSMLISIIDDRLGNAYYNEKGELECEELHPSIHNEECAQLLAKATESLADLYQKIGEWGFPYEKDNGPLTEEQISYIRDTSTAKGGNFNKDLLS